MNLGAPELIVIFLVVLLLFGAKRLPEMARSLGRSMRIFKAETRALADESNPPAQPPPAVEQAPVTPPATPPANATPPAGAIPPASAIPPAVDDRLPGGEQH